MRRAKRCPHRSATGCGVGKERAVAEARAPWCAPLRGRRLYPMPYIRRCGHAQSRSPRSERGRAPSSPSVSRAVRRAPGPVRERRDAAVRGTRRPEAQAGRDLPFVVEGRGLVRVFLGITGASGAPYAARLVEALSGADVELGISASSAGIEVLATELYANPRLSRDETLTRLLERARGGNVTVYEPNDWKAAHARGLAEGGAVLLSPCSMGTLGTIASGAMDNLIHRAASVALKEE